MCATAHLSTYLGPRLMSVSRGNTAKRLKYEDGLSEWLLYTPLECVCHTYGEAGRHERYYGTFRWLR